MFAKKELANSRIGVSSTWKISIFMFLLTLGFTACQDEGVSPNAKSKNNNIVNPLDKNISAEKPPHEPDYGG